ncbi:hypothetical protein Rhopal_004965-T1 [Rhodotorula paludigena]|uniref:Uncharacterized protein n=1 Tax=Rhodotorula paludigena TaxID=86838 RepID=A0AAV5GH67_9BASI|nr:hypothetical protein Rhopal_004965-T1 [Rhodotorula paludigena]
MATSLLPPTLDEGTVVNLIAKLQQTFYPPPSRGFTVRIGILWALTGAPRPSWTLTAIMYGFYELLYTGSFWRVYVLHRPQHAWNGIRSFDAVALFIGGWIISWTEAEASLLPSARLANAFFIGGGLLLLALNLGLAIASTVLANNLTQCYEELLAALEGLNQRLAGRFSVIAIMPAAIIAVNLGGLALARTLRAQINNSVELLVRADTHITDLPGQKEEVSEPAAVEIPLVPLASAALEADGNAVEPKEQRKASLTPSESSIRRDRRKSSFAPSECAGPRDRRKSSLTFSAIKQLAVQTDASGRATAARLQARKVLALQKAARDLQIVTLTITFISTCLLGLAIWVAWCAANDKVLRGGFA